MSTSTLYYVVNYQDDPTGEKADGPMTQAQAQACLRARDDLTLRIVTASALTVLRRRASRSAPPRAASATSETPPENLERLDSARRAADRRALHKAPAMELAQLKIAVAGFADQQLALADEEAQSAEAAGKATAGLRRALALNLRWLLESARGLPSTLSEEQVERLGREAALKTKSHRGELTGGSG